MTKYIVSAVATVLLLLLSSSGVESGEKQKDLPKNIAGLEFKDAHEFEDPRLGIGITYAREGEGLDLFIYDGGRKEIASGIDSAFVREQFEQAKADIQEAARQGMVEQASLESEGIVQLGSHEPKVRAKEAVFRLKKGESELKSYLYVTAGNNHIFKIRYTMLKAGNELQEEHRATVLREVGDLLSSWFNPGTASAQERGPSTPEERATAVKLARLLEADPLGSQAKDARQWFTVWLVQVPDISVTACSNLLGAVPRPAKKYEAEIVMQTVYSEAAFIIEHPDNAKDQVAVFRAGVEGALKAYEAIRQRKPKYVWPFLDELRKQRDSGTLQEYVEAAARKCVPGNDR